MFAEENSMSNNSKIGVIAAASIGMVLTQSSSLLAEEQDTSAAQKATKIAAPIDVDEEVLYSTLPDETLEKAAVFGGVGVCSTLTCNLNEGSTSYNKKVPPLSKSRTSKSRTVK
jgi:hypothetical protein